MIAEIGHFALILAMFLALAQAVVPLLGARRGDAAWMAVGNTAALGQLAFIVIAFAALTHAFVTSDFSVSAVAANSHTAKPLLYKVSGVWVNHEGSMLLWVLILALFGSSVALFGRNLPAPLRARVLAVQGMIGFGFLAFILLTSNPFERVFPVPAEGEGLNPLLQDPGLAFHPPFLYLGYVGFSMAFAFSVAALIEGRVDAAWARWVRPWVLAAWCFLTVGVTLGSFWAYYELGWGGWWFWDPVENASFMPWLVGTALLHSALVVENRESMVSWTVLLGILAFSLSLVGTFLVRSGVLTSVHAFALDPGRGVFILGLLLATSGGALALYAIRAPALKAGPTFAVVSREGALVLNNILLLCAAATVLLGTFYPLFIDLLSDDKISVGPPYYNQTFVPIMLPLLVLMVAGPLFKWRQDSLRSVSRQLRWIGAAALLVGALLWVFGRGLAIAGGFALAAWLILGSLAVVPIRSKLGQVPFAEALRRVRLLSGSVFGLVIAHAGMGVAIAGITAMSSLQQERLLVMRLGDVVQIAGYDVVLKSVGPTEGPNYDAQRAIFEVSRDAVAQTTLVSERRFYPERRSQTTEAGIWTHRLSNLYVTVGESNPAGGWGVRLYFHPLAPCIWLGGLLMAFGGFVSLTDRRLRVGVRHRAAASSGASAAQLAG